MPPITDMMLQMMEQDMMQKGGNSFMNRFARNIDQLARNGNSNTMMSEIKEAVKNTEMTMNMCFSADNSGVVLSSNTIMLFTIFVILWKYLY